MTKTTTTKNRPGRKLSSFTNPIHPRVTARNATFLRKVAVKNNVSYSQLVDGMISAFKSNTTFTINSANTTTSK